jgi:hypothetical protein
MFESFEQHNPEPLGEEKKGSIAPEQHNLAPSGEVKKKSMEAELSSLQERAEKLANPTKKDSILKVRHFLRQ